MMVKELTVAAALWETLCIAHTRVSRKGAGDATKIKGENGYRLVGALRKWRHQRNVRS